MSSRKSSSANTTETPFRQDSDSETKLDYALKVAEEVKPVELQKIILGEYNRNTI